MTISSNDVSNTHNNTLQVRIQQEQEHLLQWTKQPSRMLPMILLPLRKDYYGHNAIDSLVDGKNVISYLRKIIFHASEGGQE